MCVELWIINASNKLGRWQRCIESLSQEGTSFCKVVSWCDRRLFHVMSHVAFMIISISCITENGITSFLAIGTQALLALLCVETSVRSRPRNLSPAHCILDIIEARLCRIETWTLNVVLL